MFYYKNILLMKYQWDILPIILYSVWNLSLKKGFENSFTKWKKWIFFKIVGALVYVGQLIDKLMC